MTLTVAISTHGGYDEFLPNAVRSALKYADDVVVYDDGGECTPVGGRHVNLPKTGNLVAARVKAIEECQTTHLLHLDADDFLIARPPEDGDILYSDLYITNGKALGPIWSYEGRVPSVLSVAESASTPIPISKSVFRVEWLREHGLTWYRWPNTTYAEDCRTLLEYLKHDPEFVYASGEAFYAYRVHPNQMTNDQEQRVQFWHDLSDYLRGL